MSGVLLAIRLVLAAVLVVAGVAKLTDRGGARDAVAGFGVPDSLAPAVATLLPLVELAAAVLLIPSPTALAGSTLALALMAAFSAAIARSIGRGEAPDCHCFGALHSEPAGPRTLIRNLGLGAVAAVSVAGGPGTSATAWIAGLSGGGLAALLLGVSLAAAVAGGAAMAMRLLRRNGQLLLRIDELEAALASGGVAIPSESPPASAGLPVGARAPEFELQDLENGVVKLASLREETGDLLLVFSDPGCGPCSALMPQVAAWQRERGGGLRTALVSRGAAKANRAHADEYGLTDVLLQKDREAATSFHADATPAAVIVAADGTIASAVHTGEEQIRTLVASRSRVELEVHRPEPTAGAPAPDAKLRTPAPDPKLRTLAPDPKLRNLAGEPVALSSALAGRATLLVFWNPACGFCERMVEQLRAIDDAALPGAAALAVISTGDPDTNRAMGLRAPILLDDAFAAGNAFGAAGTPSAVLVDERGRLASSVAVGADAVLAMAGVDGAAIAA